MGANCFIASQGYNYHQYLRGVAVWTSTVLVRRHWAPREESRWADLPVDLSAAMLHRVVRRCDGSAGAVDADDTDHVKPRTPEELLRQAQATR